MPRSPEEREWGETRPEAGVGELTFPWPIRETAKRILTAGAPPQPQVVRRDALQRLVEQTDPDGLVQRFGYDCQGNCVSVWDKDGQQQQREYGSWNLCLARIDPLGNTTRYRYTPRQKVAAIVDPMGNESEYAYDYKDRLIQVKRHGVIREKYRYDIGDRLIEKRDGEDNPLLTLEIGANGLQSKRVLASGGEHRFAYDRYGNITEASTSESRVLIGYQERRRVSDLRDGRGVEHRYEDQRLASTTYFGRFTVRYEILGPGDAAGAHPGRPPVPDYDRRGWRAPAPDRQWYARVEPFRRGRPLHRAPDLAGRECCARAGGHLPIQRDGRTALQARQLEGHDDVSLRRRSPPGRMQRRRFVLQLPLRCERQHLVDTLAAGTQLRRREPASRPAGE